MLQISGLPSGAYHPVKPRTKLESATLLGRSSLMGVSSTCNISTSGGYWKSNIIEKIVYLDKSVDHLITQLCMFHLQRATFTKVFVGGTTLACWCQGLSFCAMKPKNLLTYQEVTVDGDFCGVLCRHVALVEWNSRLCMPPKCHPDTIPPLRRTWIRQQSILQFLTAPLKDNCSLSRFPTADVSKSTSSCTPTCSDHIAYIYQKHCSNICCRNMVSDHYLITSRMLILWMHSKLTLSIPHRPLLPRFFVG